MFPNLNAEMARRNMTVNALSIKTGIPYSSLAPKLRGQRSIKVEEAVKIKDALETNLAIKTLFSTKAEVN